MTKKQCLDKIRSMLYADRKYVLKESERLLNSGGINYESFDNNYIMPRIVLKVALKNFMDQVALANGTEKDVKNLLHF